MKIFLFTIVFLLISLTLSSQTEDTNKCHNVLGLSLSTFSGYGLMYQYVFNNDYRLKFAGIYYPDPETDIKGVILNFGVEIQRTIKQLKYTRCYLTAGLNYSYMDINYSGIYYPNHLFSNMILGGVGFGTEFTAWQHLLINIDIGFSCHNRWEQNSDTILYSGKFYNHFEYGLGIGFGLGYIF
ncbi:MAG: hypothetical protein ABSG15_14260 [FCB group bacterium]